MKHTSETLPEVSGSDYDLFFIKPLLSGSGNIISFSSIYKKAEAYIKMPRWRNSFR